VQNELFLVGSDLASVLSKRPPQMKVVGAEEATRLEGRIDSMNETLGPLTEFILPGGGALGAQLHLARTACRRAERGAVALAGRGRARVAAPPAAHRRPARRPGRGRAGAARAGRRRDARLPQSAERLPVRAGAVRGEAVRRAGGAVAALTRIGSATGEGGSRG